MKTVSARGRAARRPARNTRKRLFIGQVSEKLVHDGDRAMIRS